jgi:hypothetical protein
MFVQARGDEFMEGEDELVIVIPYTLGFLKFGSSSDPTILGIVWAASDIKSISVLTPHLLSTLHTAGVYAALTKVHTTTFTCFPRVWCSGIIQSEVRLANHRLFHTAIIPPNYTQKEVELNLRKSSVGDRAE